MPSSIMKDFLYYMHITFMNNLPNYDTFILLLILKNMKFVYTCYQFQFKVIKIKHFQLVRLILQKRNICIMNDIDIIMYEIGYRRTDFFFFLKFQHFFCKWGNPGKFKIYLGTYFELYFYHFLTYIFNFHIYTTFNSQWILQYHRVINIFAVSSK